MENLLDSPKNFWIRIPDSREVHSQADEYFTVSYQNREQVLKLHDYAEIYKIPGLYKHVLLDILGDQSPATLSALLVDQVLQTGASVADLNVLDMGAGIGISGRSLAQNGVQSIVGLDILPEAREASLRDLPGTYSNYYVADLSRLPNPIRTDLMNRRFNCLMCCSALTCHLPIQAFLEAFNLIQNDGWIAFNISQSKLTPEVGQDDEFYNTFQSMIEGGAFHITCTHQYQHRRSMNGKPIHYCAVVGRKKHPFPEGLLE